MHFSQRPDRGVAETHQLDEGAPTAGIEIDPYGGLVERMAGGDERAAGQLFATLHGPLLRVAQSIVHERADAEEVVNDAFSQAWREAGRFDHVRGSVLRWLTTIVRSRSLDLLRARSRRERAHDRFEASATADFQDMGPRVGLDQCRLEAQELERAVTHALQQLPQPQRQVLELAFLQEATHTMVAEQLGIPLGTIKTRARLGLSRMRQVLRAT